VLVKRGGVWQVVLYQNTNITEPAKQAEVSAAQTTNQLAGTYRMISYQRTVVATGETTEPMGKAPQGHVIYGREGRFVMFYVADGRPTPSGLATMTDQERADLFKTMVAYSGTYDFDGQKVTHHVDISFNQIWTGTNQ
jgi:hypothetical protein